MGSLNALFNLSKGALAADQAALAATSNNVANQNTVGYTREVVTFQEGDSVSLSGDGVHDAPAVTIASQRDRVLEQRVQQQTQATSSTTERSANLSQIENVFSLASGTSAGSTQIGTTLDGLFSALTSLSSNPADAATQQSVLTAASSLAGSLNSAALQVASLATNVGATLASSVDAVNGLTSTIAKLNAQIAGTGSTADASTLEDQRQTAIASLSQYIGLDQISTEHNGITLTTTGGSPLVAGNQAFALSAVSVGGATQIQDGTGTNLNTQITGGSMGGDLATLNVDVPQVTGGLDALAFRLASAVNAQNMAGVTSSGAAGAAIFSIPSSASGAAASIAVNAGSAPATGSVGEGSTGNTNALALAALQQGTDSSGKTIQSSYASLLANVGNSSSSLQEQGTAQQATLTQLTTQRDSLSAVSMDEEASNLTEYQNSYNAAAKLFSILNSVMTSAINLGVETTVS